MSAIFRAELANLQLLVARAERDAEHNTNERERARMATNTRSRAEHLHHIARRGAVANRKTIVTWLKKHASRANPLSANKVSEGTGIASETARKHLRLLAQEDSIAEVRTAGGQSRYYMETK